MTGKPRTLYQKIWDAHIVDKRSDGTCLIYVDRHLVHEVTSPQAFEGLRAAGRTVRRPDLTLAVPDHNLPTTPRLDPAGNRIPIADPAISMLRRRSRGLSMLSGRNRVSRSPAPRSFAAIAIPLATVASARSRSGSERAKLSMFSPRKRCCLRNRNRWKCGLKAKSALV
jgi:hypothetical protein